MNYLYRVYCVTFGEYYTTLSATEPPEIGGCPEHGDNIDTDQTVIIQNIFHTPGYNIVRSDLPDNRAVQILADSSAGGIYISSGNGGILVESSNAIQLNGGAASGITTSLGNITLHSQAALVNIDGNSGVNIGSTEIAAPINIGATGTGVVNIGSTIGTTTNISSGAGGFLLRSQGGAGTIAVNSTAPGHNLTLALNGATDSQLILSSAGIGVAAIDIFSSGGFNADITGQCTWDANGLLQLTSNRNLGNDITLQTPNGGILVNAGVFGLAMDAVGTGVIYIGNFGNTGPIEIGHSGSSRNIAIGNTAGSSGVVLRNGAGGRRISQAAHVELADADAALTAPEIKVGIFTIAPSSTRTLTMPAAASFIAAFNGAEIDDAVDFHIINLGTNSASLSTLVSYGNMDIDAGNSAYFRARITNVGGGSEAYIVYRIA